MMLHKIIEEKIQEAIARGEFDNLEGAGRPIDLTSYFNMPAELRAGYSLLKSNKFVPEEVEIMRDIGDLKAKIKVCADEEELRKLRKRLSERQMNLSILIERNRRGR